MLTLLLAAALLQQSSQLFQPGLADSGILSISSVQAHRHLIGEEPAIRIKSRRPMIYAVAVDTMVDEQGRVVFAALSPDYPDDQKREPKAYEQAESLVRALRFTPFKRHGRPVAVFFRQDIAVLPRELKPLQHTAAPKVSDWGSVKIKLARLGCGLGWCPDYSLEIHGDGSVLYEGRGGVHLKGQQLSSVPRENLIELLKIIEQNDYYSLRNRYGGCGYDGADVFLSVEIDGHRKTLEDCEGEWVGMPLSVKHIEGAIDRLSGAERWAYSDFMENPNLDR